MSLPRSDSTHHSDSFTEPKAKHVPLKENEKQGKPKLLSLLKAGDCKDIVINWEQCFKEGKKKENLMIDCTQETMSLIECFKAHSDHYGAILISNAPQDSLKQNGLEKKEGLKCSNQK